MEKARVTSKGQVTIPVEVRRALGIEPGDDIYFLRDDGTARIVKFGSAVEDTAGAFKRYARRPAPSARELREMAEESWAEEADERSRPRG